MQCHFEFEVTEPNETDMIFHPHLKFKFVQLNMTPELITDGEIDFQADQLIKEIGKMRKEAKNKLKQAIKRHDKLLEKKRRMISE